MAITAAFANEDIQAIIVKQVGQIYIIPAINFKSGILKLKKEGQKICTILRAITLRSFEKNNAPRSIVCLLRLFLVAFNWLLLKSTLVHSSVLE